MRNKSGSRSQSLGEIKNGFSWDNNEVGDKIGSKATKALGSRQSVDNYKDVAL